MRRYSILFSITLIFLISFIALISLFIVLREKEMKGYLKDLGHRHSIALRFSRKQGLKKFFNNKQNSDLRLELIDNSFEKTLIEKGRIIDKHIFDKHKNHKKIKDNLIKDSSLPPHHRRPPLISVDAYKYEGSIYSVLHFKDKKVIFKDLNDSPDLFELQYIILFLSNVILVFVYITLIKKLKPLKVLQGKVREFGQGNMDIDCQVKGTDEIANLSNEFHQAMQEIKNLNESRTLFLRNLMHEIHTPIAKGMILSELLEEGSNKNKFSKIFTRLDLLLEEIAQYEKLKSGQFKMNIASYPLIDIIDSAEELLMIEEEDFQHQVKGVMVDVDFDLFTLAIKNIIDNAIKYSPDRNVRIEVIDGDIYFTSKGEPLQYPLSTYQNPFYKGSDEHHGLGLGLYIVTLILKSHNKTLDYAYFNENNVFIFRK